MTVFARPIYRILAVLLSIGLLSSAIPAPAQAAARSCTGLTVRIDLANDREFAAACNAAWRALEFWSAQGLNTALKIDIGMLASPSHRCPPRTFGCFDARTQQVFVLNSQACLALGDWAGRPITPEVCDSHIAHEIAHAIVAANFKGPRQTVLAHEYLAYVTLFATLPPTLRKDILARYPGTGFASEQEMSVTYLLFDPVRFGAEAYRHFLKPGNGARFVERILTGDALSRAD